MARGWSPFFEVEAVKVAGEFEVSTSYLSRVLEALVQAHPAPSIRGRNIKLKVATRAVSLKDRDSREPTERVARTYKLSRKRVQGRLDLIGNPFYRFS